MGGEVCYRKGYERGPWYEIKTVKDTILLNHAAGKDTSFARGLLKAWAKVPGYEGAGEALKEIAALITNGQNTVTKVISVNPIAPQTVTPRSASESTITLPVTPPCDTLTARCRELSAQGASTRQIAELLKLEGIFVSHMNVQRRLQGALI